MTPFETDLMRSSELQNETLQRLHKQLIAQQSGSESLHKQLISQQSALEKCQRGLMAQQEQLKTQQSVIEELSSLMASLAESVDSLIE